jgi:hypothetical protein
MTQLDFHLFSSSFDTAWKQELFYSKYPANTSYDYIDTDTPQNVSNDEQIDYTFNEYGFRSDSFTQRKEFNILTSGCSLTVGVGVKYENTWTQLLKTHFNQPTTIWNLAQSSTSPDYVVRSIYKTIDILKPNLVAVCWPAESRVELAKNKHTLTNYQLDTPDYPKLLANPNWAYHNFQKNIILLKQICLVRNIPLVHGPGEYTDFGINPDTTARDGSHPGNKWHQQYAKLVAQQYSDKYE